MLCIAGQQLSSFFATLPYEKKLRMTTYHGIKACCFCTLYIVFWRMDGPGANLERLLSRCGKQGHAEPLTFRAKFHALYQYQKTTVRPACRRSRYEKTARKLWQENCREPQSQLKKHSPKRSWTGSFLKALQSSTASVIFIFGNNPLWREET